jgi:RHS repeat-associated protein
LLFINGTETRFLVDPNQPYAQVLEEYSPSGTVQVAYVYGLDLISQTQGAIRSYFHTDGLGSTRVLTDSTGNVLNTYNYNPFGEILNSSGSTANKYLFAGEQFDSTLGDYYLRARFYDPDSGRFTRRDSYEGSLSNPLSLHRYSYAHNNPVNNIDPTGLFTLVDAGITLTGFAILGIAYYIGSIQAGPPPENLGGFGEDSQPATVLNSIFAWKNTWIPELSGGFGEGRQPSVPIHTGRSTDVVDLAQHVFEAQFRGPAAKSFDWDHILDRHSSWGKTAQLSGKKTIFEGLTEPQIKRTVMNAWKDREKVEIQDDFITGERRIRYRGLDTETGYEVEMWLNQNSKRVETAYPVNRY